MKIIITHSSELSMRWISYYCLDDLCNVFDIEYWDCSSFSYPSFKSHPSIKRSYLHVIHSLMDMKENFERIHSDSIIVTDIHRNKWNYEIHKLQSSFFKNVIYIDFFSNTMFGFSEKDSHVYGLLNKLLQYIKQTKLYKKNRDWLLAFKDPAKCIDVYYRKKCSKLYNNIYVFSCKQGSEFKINHPDFEQYLKLKDTTPQHSFDYILYLDNFFPYHVEISRYQKGFSPEVVADPFYKSMNHFFDMLEKEYDCKVIIAAHPTAIYEKNPFDGRQIVYGKTAELVKDCKAVCIHNSNTMSYVVLYNKPLAILHNKAFRSSTLLWPRLPVISSALKIPLTDTDEIHNVNNVFRFIEDDIRQEYICKYLERETTSDVSNRELFISYYKKVFQLINCS